MRTGFRRRTRRALALAGVVIGMAPLVMAEQRSVVVRSESRALTDPCSERITFWQRVQVPSIERYCGLIISSRASLWSRPDRAARLARQAHELLEAGMEAPLLLATAELVSKRPEEAHRRFSNLLDRSRESEIATVFRVAAARAALLSGDAPEALRHYRRLALAIDRVDGPRKRTQVLVEAAIAASYSNPAGTREGVAYVRQSREHFAPLLEPIRQAVAVLLFLRAGQVERARALSGPREAAWALSWIFDRTGARHGAPGEVLPVLPPGESAALVAGVLEAHDREAAADHWSEFLEQAPQAPKHIRSMASSRGGKLPSARAEKALPSSSKRELEAEGSEGDHEP